MCGTRSLSDILGELVTIRGYGHLWIRQILENAWNTAIGEPDCHQTQVGEMRRGVLNVTVAHPSLLEELVAFRKGTLLASLRSSAPGICDIQFRVGSMGIDTRKSMESSVSQSAQP
jgi:Dna[CI] antecedent, DciA